MKITQNPVIQILAETIKTSFLFFISLATNIAVIPVSALIVKKREWSNEREISPTTVKKKVDKRAISAFRNRASMIVPRGIKMG